MPTHLNQGLLFASVAVIFWGIAPVALKISVEFIDAISLTWIRFAVALAITFLIQIKRRQLKQFRHLTRRDWLLLFITALLLITNYNTYVFSLDYLSPGVAQLNFQAAPFYLALGGYFFYRERLNQTQLFCFIGLLIGMLLFFSPLWQNHYTTSEKLTPLLKGLGIIQFSALCWCTYALLQKQILQKLSPQNVLLFIYFIGVFIMLPFTHLDEATHFNTEQNLIIIFCCINTLIAYGAFAQAMNTMDAVQISALVSLTPIIAFACAGICAALSWWPLIILSPTFTFASTTGMIFVIVSAVGVQVWKTKKAAN